MLLLFSMGFAILASSWILSVSDIHSIFPTLTPQQQRPPQQLEEHSLFSHSVLLPWIFSYFGLHELARAATSLADNFGLWPKSVYADDVIIGVLDTGIWPQRPSFSASGLSLVPGRLKGKCEVTADFLASSCNGKIIGARALYKGYESYLQRPINESVESTSARDTEGRRTHTATAAGSLVLNASFYEYPRGEARGMASKARIAVYKICWSLGCFDSVILAAMDQAISDGFDVISLSVGFPGHAPPYYSNSIAIGAFGSTQHGIVVSCSAGNSGPGPYTAVNIAPWIITVSASTMDREFPADVVLGDDRVLNGVSLYSGNGLDDNKDGLGMILAYTEDKGEEFIADSNLIPATMVGQTAGNKEREYIAGLTRQMTHPALDDRFVSDASIAKFPLGSLQSTLYVVESRRNCNGGSPNGLSAVSLPPTTLDLFISTTSVARRRMNDEAYMTNHSKGLLIPPRNPSRVHVPMKDSNATSEYYQQLQQDQFQHLRKQLMMKQQSFAFWGNQMSQNNGWKNDNAGNRNCHPVGFSPSVWPLQESQNQGSGMRVVLLVTDCDQTLRFLNSSVPSKLKGNLHVQKMKPHFLCGV